VNVTVFTPTSSNTVTQCTPEATAFGELTQNKGHYAIQGHRFCYQSKAHIDCLLVININLPPILHCFRDIAFDRSKFSIFGYPSCVELPNGGVPLGRSLPWMSTDGQCTKWHRNIVENFNRLSRVHERYRQTSRQTGNII